MQYRLTKNALRDLQAATSYYASRNPAVATLLSADVQQQLRLLTAHPYAGSKIRGDYRRVTLRRFPYSLVYRVDEVGDGIVVVTFADQRRRPESWLGRLEEARAVYLLPSMAA